MAELNGEPSTHVWTLIGGFVVVIRLCSLIPGLESWVGPAVTLGLLDGSRPVCSSVNKQKKRSNNRPYLRDVVFVSIKRVHE